MHSSSDTCSVSCSILFKVDSHSEDGPQLISNLVFWLLFYLFSICKDHFNIDIEKNSAEQEAQQQAACWTLNPKFKPYELNATRLNMEGRSIFLRGHNLQLLWFLCERTESRIVSHVYWVSDRDWWAHVDSCNESSSLWRGHEIAIINICFLFLNGVLSRMEANKSQGGKNTATDKASDIMFQELINLWFFLETTWFKT